MSPFADNLSSNLFTKLLTSSKLPIRILSNYACETGVEMTTDQRDVYSSHPAFSILASALVSPREPSQQKTLNHTSTWNLETDINGFSKLSKYRNDRRKLLRCGTTIGFSYLREWGDVNLQSRDLLGDVFSPSLIETRSKY